VLPPRAGESHEFSLIMRPKLHEILRQREAQEGVKVGPVAIGGFSPQYQPMPPNLGLPALEMPPPAEVAIAVPDHGPRAELRLAAGVANAGYIGEEREIRFEAIFEGETVFDHTIIAKEGVPDSERQWEWGRFPVGGGGRLVLRTSSSGPELEATRAGFGLLEIVVPVEIARVPSSKKRPNVVLILLDTLRADRLHAYGGKLDITPHLDALAERGMLFERAYAASPWTVPSTTAILVGLQPHEQALFDNDTCYLGDDSVTLAEVFRTAPAATAAWVANPLVGLARNFDQGFDEFHEPSGAPSRAVMDQVEPWLREHFDERFFLYLHLYDTHGPVAPEEDLAARLVGEEPPRYTETYRTMMEQMLVGEEVKPKQLKIYRRHALQLYDAEVAGVDRQIGRLVALLAELDLDEKTLIAFTSDHGEEFLEHSMQGHSKQLYDESIRVPLILAGPGVPRGRRVQRPVENRHLAPTLLQLAGLAPTERLQGENLTAAREDDARPPILTSTDLGWWRVPIEGSEGSEGTGGFRVLRRVDIYGAEEGGFRLQWTPSANGEPARHRLLDLEGDPHQLRDVSAEHPDKVEALQRWIESELAKVQNEARTSPEFLDAVGYAGDQ
jgi:arylsulfatase A-like enzyme